MYFIRMDHPYARIDNNMEVNMQCAPSTPHNTCVSVNRDNNRDVIDFPSTSFDTCMLSERGLLGQMKVRRVVDLTSNAKFLYKHAKTMKRKYVEQVVGTLQPTIRRFLLQQQR